MMVKKALMTTAALLALCMIFSQGLVFANPSFLESNYRDIPAIVSTSWLKKI
jgi:hypothetical protein